MGVSMGPFTAATKDFSDFDTDLNKIQTATANIINNFKQYGLLSASGSTENLSKFFDIL